MFPAAQAGATLCKYFNIPMYRSVIWFAYHNNEILNSQTLATIINYSWAATSIALDDEVRYPSTIKVISTALR